MTAYYNEIDPFAAQWLRNLIKRGLIAPGDVDTRSITEVLPDDVKGYTQCHFFAGVGCWSYALRLAQWPDDRPVWTGSAPCQPFSSAGKRAGFDDRRHLAPAWLELVGECRPAAVFAEQVDAAVGANWADYVFDSLEAIGYACGAVVFPAASVGAPHARHRLYVVGYAAGAGLRAGGREKTDVFDESNVGPLFGGPLDDAERNGCERGGESQHEKQQSAQRIQSHGSGARGWWHRSDWVLCGDGKTRQIEPGTQPLVDGAAARVGRLRAYGNAIVAPQAAEFIKAFMDCHEENVT